MYVGAGIILPTSTIELIPGAGKGLKVVTRGAERVVVEEASGKVLGKIGNAEPYDASKWRDNLESTYGKDNVASTTIPSNPRQRVNSNPANGVEVIENASGKAVQIRYTDPVTGTVKDANIPYDSRGLPVFDDVAAYTTKIDSSKSYSAQMSQATRDLRDAINSGKVDVGHSVQPPEKSGRYIEAEKNKNGATHMAPFSMAKLSASYLQALP